MMINHLKKGLVVLSNVFIFGVGAVAFILGCCSLSSQTGYFGFF